MVKLKLENSQKIKLQKGDKIIERPFVDYQSNKNVWEFRGFKPVEDVVKDDKVVELKPKRKTRKKKDEQVDLEKD
mgnify:CR=1 FL=1|jgi:hypothetical protein|tara:strand:- start:461 stop:685 length:225 start_codon:yes stop_codon:yes gene_type:complete